MLIGIDMLGVQSSAAGERESARLGRRLVAALLARDPANRYVLYTHEGRPTDRVPSSKNALRVSLGCGPDGPRDPRSTIQRVLDHNPDGLDWLVLLDPFEPAYGAMSPESPLNGVKVASVVVDLAPERVDDRRLAPLRRHDAILAFSARAADECRRRLPSAGRKVIALNPAADESPASTALDHPMGVADGEELARLGIDGPFLLASPGRDDLGVVLETYRALPAGLRAGLKLVIAGDVADPWAAVAYLHDEGCAEGLVLVGSVDESTSRTLHSRCSAYLASGIDEGSPLALIDAMAAGAPVVAVRGEILGDAALFADPPGLADLVERVVTDAELARDLRRRSIERAGQFPWEPVVKVVLDLFGGTESGQARTRLRFDRAHVARPRIALFATADREGSATVGFSDEVARICRGACDVDLYVETADRARLERLPVDFAGFDARLFARNDAILGYRAVVSVVPDVFALRGRIGRLWARPGVVVLEDESSLDRIGPGASGEGAAVADVEGEAACRRLRELFLTSSRLAVRSPLAIDAIRSALPAFADRAFEWPDAAGLLAGLMEGDSAGSPRGLGRSPSAPHLPMAVAGVDSSPQLAKGDGA